MPTPNPTTSTTTRVGLTSLSQTAVAFWTLTVGTLVMLILIATLAAVTRLPDATSGTVLAVFPPRTPTDDVFAAVDQTDARIIRATLFSNAWIVESQAPDFVGRLRGAGALAAWKPVSGVSFAVGGCGFGAIMSNDPAFDAAAQDIRRLQIPAEQSL
ncbi:MAG: hypothetical protein CME01_04665 [Geminicoccus sp.]|nr:hypothetical protein [Geminicoccus sp.]MDB2403656.1 hypothetical protein [bacterium]